MPKVNRIHPMQIQDMCTLPVYLLVGGSLAPHFFLSFCFVIPASEPEYDESDMASTSWETDFLLAAALESMGLDRQSLRQLPLLHGIERALAWTSWETVHLWEGAPGSLVLDTFLLQARCHLVCWPLAMRKMAPPDMSQPAFPAEMFACSVLDARGREPPLCEAVWPKMGLCASSLEIAFNLTHVSGDSHFVVDDLGMCWRSSQAALILQQPAERQALQSLLPLKLEMAPTLMFSNMLPDRSSADGFVADRCGMFTLARPASVFP